MRWEQSTPSQNIVFSNFFSITRKMIVRIKKYLVVILGVVVLIMDTSAFGADFYVAPMGDDSNPGTKDKPFKTLTKARDSLRHSDDSDRVIIREGIYQLTDTFELGKQDSNTTFMAAPGETVRIIGGQTILPSAVKPVSDSAILNRIISTTARSQIKQLDLNELGLTNYGELGIRGFRRPYIPAPMELLIDGKVQMVARWPNVGEKHIPMGRVIDRGSTQTDGDYSVRGGTFEYSIKRPEQWTQATDLYISGIFHFSWADDTIKVAKLDTTKGTFTTTHPHTWNFQQDTYTSWYALNLLEEIDQAGEFYINKDNKILYFYPPDGFSSKSEILVSALDKPMIAIEDAIGIRLERIIIEATRDVGIYIEAGKGNEIVGCTLRNIGSLAIQIGKGTKPLPYGKHDCHGKTADGNPAVPASRMMGNWHEHIYKYTTWNRNAGTEHKIINCDIHDIGAGGIMLGGGDRKTLTPGNNLVKNCNIYRVNRWDRTYKAPINVDGVGNIIVNNHLHQCPGSAIYLHGNDHIVEYNEIDNVVTDSSDMGAIYMGRDPSESGHSFSYNFFHNIKNYHNGGFGVQAIFIDDCSFGGARIIGNIFYKAGSTNPIKFNGGGDCEIRNNIFIDCRPPVGGGGNNTDRCREFMKSVLGHERLRVQVDITKPPYSTKYPRLLAAYQNQIPIVTKPECNYVVNKDYSQFIDAAKMNFTLKADSKVYQEIKGFQPIPFDKIGVHR